MTDRNEAAERLRTWLDITATGTTDLDEALAAERRATAREILERLEEQASLREKTKLYARIRKVILEVAR